jgi:hypothetical protein
LVVDLDGEQECFDECCVMLSEENDFSEKKRGRQVGRRCNFMGTAEEGKRRT